MFKVGDRVRFLNDVGQGVVIRIISEDQVMVEDESGFDYPYPMAELVPIQDVGKEADAYFSREPDMREMLNRNVDPEQAKRANRQFKDKYKEREEGAVRYRGDVVEVDLHIHELVESESGLDPSAMIEIQMRHFERMMGRAERERIPCLVFIHGVGQGVLRAEIRKHLNQYYPDVTFQDADFRVYGYGATEVRLK